MTKSMLIKSSFIIIAMTLLGKALGFIRDAMMAAQFGASYATDIYNFASGMATLVFASIGSGIATTFIPMLTEHIQGKSKEETNRFVNNIVTIAVIVIIILMTLGIVFSKYVVALFAPGFVKVPSVYSDAIQITRIMFLTMLFMGLQNIYIGVLQCHGEFTIPSSISALSNIVYIVYLTFFAKKYGIYGFTIVTVIAYFLQFSLQMPKARSFGYKYRFVFDLKDRNFRRMLVLMVPVIIGTSVNQVNILVDRMIGTSLGEGAISVLNYAYRLNNLVYAIFAAAITTIIYPTLSAYSAKGDSEGYKGALVKAVNSLLLIMIPATIGMAVLRLPIIEVIYKRGAFTDNDAILTASALLFYSPSMMFVGIRDIFGRAFYSVKDTKTPMINSVIGIVMNIIFNLLFARLIGVGGLALASSIAMVTTTVLLMWNLNRKLKNIGIRDIVKTGLKVMCASIVMGIVVHFINGALISGLGNTLKGNIISLAISITSGVLVYFAVIHFMKIDEYMYMINLIKKKLNLKA